jgi:DNA-binding MarR family transcriptional regulator
MHDVLRSLPGYSLRRASAAMLAEFSALLAPLNLRPTEASLLMLIDANPAITPTALGQLLGIKRANMVPLVARLDDWGYTARESIDGRSFGLTLTAAGHTICVKVKAAVALHERQLMDRIPQEHRAHFGAALNALWQRTD